MKYFESIDELPIYNWNEIHKTGDLTFMLIDRTKTKGVNFKKLLEQWELIYEQYILKFGFDSHYLSILEKQLYIAELIIEKAETGDNSINTFIELEKQLLLKLQEKNKSTGDFYESKSRLEKELGFYIDIRKCSVVEFYSYIKTIEKDAK
jgi:hypothetical protein